jgi:hypothetical protein
MNVILDQYAMFIVKVLYVVWCGVAVKIEIPDSCVYNTRNMFRSYDHLQVEIYT